MEHITIGVVRWPSEEERECVEELCKVLNMAPDEVRLHAVASFILTVVAHTTSPWDAFRWLGQGVEEALPAALEDLSSWSRPN